MKFSWLLLSFSFINCEKLFKNVNIPLCKNCIYYKPSLYYDFESNFNECEIFDRKNDIKNDIKSDIKNITKNIISYYSVDLCRNNETKCGKEGKYFKKEKNIMFKKIKYIIKQKSLHILLILSIIISSIINMYAMYYLISLSI
jgi:hypothetical protein